MFSIKMHKLFLVINIQLLIAIIFASLHLILFAILFKTFSLAVPLYLTCPLRKFLIYENIKKYISEILFGFGFGFEFINVVSIEA